MTKTLKLCILAFVGFLFLQSNATTDVKVEEMAVAAPKVKFPKKVNAIIQNKCYGCHSEKGRSDKAKKALRWDELASISAKDQMHKLEEIVEVVEEGNMPPSRFLESNPDKKLTEKEAAKMAKWAKKMGKRVAK